MTGVHEQEVTNRIEPVRLFYVRVNLTIPLSIVVGAWMASAVIVYASADNSILTNVI